MAKHKAATEVTIVQEERSALAHWVDRYKVPFIVGAVALSAGILFLQSRGQKAVQADRAQWSELYQALGGAGAGVRPSVQMLDAEALEKAASNVGGKSAASWSHMLAALAFAEDGDFDRAKGAINRLGDDPLLRDLKLPLGPNGEARSLEEHVKASVEATQAFREANPLLFENPPPLEGSPVAVIDTTLGPIEVALAEDRAPVHVANFVELAEEGFYENTKFHRVIAGFMIQGGDPNTKEDDKATWGQGGTDEKLDREESGLLHFPMVLAAAKMPGDVQSSGCQFYITTGSPHHLDGQHVVYGQVIAGEDIVRTIEQGDIEEGTSDRPAQPVAITSVTIRK